MARVELPRFPAPAKVIGPHPIDFGGMIGGALGGATQYVDRLGKRWWYGAQFAPIEDPDVARAWAADLNRGRRLGVTMAIRQPGLARGVPGSPLVKGAGQSGFTIEADGFLPGYRVRKGQFFSLLTSGQRYLQQASSHQTADSSGEIDIEVEPQLRVSPADNAVLEFAVPKIDGLLDAVPEHEFDSDQLARGFAIKIVESR